MSIVVGRVVPNPEYPNLFIGVDVFDNGTVSLGRGQTHQNQHTMPPEVAAQLAQLLVSAAEKSPAVVRAVEEAKRMERQLAQATADRLAAIAEGRTDMRVHMTVELESDDAGN